MIAMFDFACGPGYSTYLQVRQCIRKTTTRENIRECVSEFSRSSPQIACQSSRKLLACSIPVINEKCGQVGAQFVTDYIDKFVNVVDPTCKIGMQQSDKSIRGYNCTIEENARISYCAAPINELTSRIDELFEGGLQQFLVNVKNLAPVFAKGCNLTKEFRHCLGPLIEQQSEQQCTISSCLIQAGNGICNQPDTAKAIDDNLACVFKQASIPEFGRCLRSTIATLKQFNLIALRGVLPQFIKCIQHIVVQHCGEIPLNVLRAISATDICPISFNYHQLGSVSGDKTQICNTEMQQKHAECTGNFYGNYRMLPIALLRDPSSIDMLCVDLSKLATCSYPICDTAKQKALNALAEFICTRRDTYKEHSMCLMSVITSSEGSKCLTSFLPTASEQQCSFLTNVANCATPSIHNTCGYEALALSFEGMHIFANALNKSCSVQIPIASVKTSCAESDIVEYLQCENLIDHFTFTPFSFIRNSSQWNEFCEVIRDYENCLTNMSCRVEPISSANIALFRTICGKEESKTKYFLPCLTHFITTDIGKKCSEPFVGLDLLAKDNSQKICSTLKSMLSCASSELSAQCSEQALKHVVSMFLIWVRKFDPSCSISGYGAIDGLKIEEDFSLDSGPLHISVDQTALPVNQRIPSITTTPLLPKPNSDNSLSDSNNFLTTGSTTVSEMELLTVSQPDSSSSSSDIESVSHRRTGISSTTLPVPELNPESINAENDFTDSTSSLQQSLFDISPKTKSNVTINAKKSKMQESGQMRSNPLHLWILSIVIIMSTIIMPFVQ